MSSEQELNRAEELLKRQEAINKAKEKQREIDADILGLSSGLVDSIKEIQGISTRRSTFDQNILKVNKDINKEILGQKSGLSDVSTIQKQISKNADLIKKSEKTSESIISSLGSIEKKRVALANERIAQIRSQRSIQEGILKQTEQGGVFAKEAYDASVAEQAQKEASLENIVKQLGPLAQQAVFTQQNTDELERQNELREKEKETLEAINSSLGLSGGLAKAFGKIPGLGDKSEKAFGKVQDKIKGMVEKDGIGAIPNRLTTASMFAKEFGTILMDAATDPLVIITAIGAAMLKNNIKITEFSRSMAMSTEDAKTFAGEFSSIAYSSDDINTTTANLVHNFQDMSEALGFMAKFSKDTLETSTKLQYSLGISAESVANLAGAAEVTGGNFDDQYKNALAISHEAQRELGVRVDLRKVLEQSGKVTGQIRANLGGSIEEIAKAVTKATLFGSTLEDVANMGSKLLDFESSITAELEAEMLIGKNLNLERARAAALAGDQVTLMEELNSQMGSLEDFQNMNVIQQQALASAMGMTGDQLSDILMKQEIQGRTAEELKAMGKDELAAIVEKQDAQQSFNAAVAQLKGLLADSVKFLNPIMEGFSFIVQKAVEFKGVFLALTGLQLAYIGYQKISKALKVADLALTKKNFFQSLGSLIVEAAKSVAKIPFIGPALAIAAGAAIYGAFKGYGSKGDDVMSPGGNASGYGNRTLFGPEGAISLNNKDTVIAGTNLFDKGDDVISKGAGEVKIPTQDNRVGNETNRLLQTLIGQNAKKPELSPVGLYEVQ
jgi:hypothetical protein